MEWWSIEVFNGRSSAARWKDAYEATLVEAALTNGAVDWAWHEYRWGVVLEVAFTDEPQWERFHALPAVQAALDATPDPVKGLVVHRGRGGSSGTRLPRRPRPLAGAGAVELPEPDPDPIQEEPLAPSFLEPGFYDDRPAPEPDPAPLSEPAARAAGQSAGHGRHRTEPGGHPGACGSRLPPLLLMPSGGRRMTRE